MNSSMPNKLFIMEVFMIFLIKPLQYEKSLSSILACMAKLKAMRSESQMRSTLEQNNLRLKASQIVKHLLEDEVPLTVNSIQHLLKFTSKDRKSTRLNSSHVASSYAVF